MKTKEQTVEKEFNVFEFLNTIAKRAEVCNRCPLKDVTLDNNFSCNGGWNKPNEDCEIFRQQG